MSSTNGKSTATACQLVAAITVLMAFVEQCRERNRIYAKAHPDHFFELLLPLDDLKELERLDAEVYGLAAALGLTILSPPEQQSRRSLRIIHTTIGGTHIPVLKLTQIIPNAKKYTGKSAYILSDDRECEVGGWATRMTTLLRSAELLTSEDADTDGPKPPGEFHWKGNVCEGLSLPQFQFLMYLWDGGRKRGVATYEELLMWVWPKEVTDSAIKTFVSRLNTKLNTDGKNTDGKTQGIYIGLAIKNRAVTCTWE